MKAIVSSYETQKPVCTVTNIKSVSYWNDVIVIRSASEFDNEDHYRFIKHKKDYVVTIIND